MRLSGCFSVGFFDTADMHVCWFDRPGRLNETVLSLNLRSDIKIVSTSMSISFLQLPSARCLSILV